MTTEANAGMNIHGFPGVRAVGLTVIGALAIGMATAVTAATSTFAASTVASWEFNQVGGVIPDLQAGDDSLTLSGRWSSVTGNGTDTSAIRFEATPSSATTTAANGQRFNPGTGPFELTVVFRVTKDVTSGSPNVAQHGKFNDPGQIKMQLARGGRAGCRIKGDRAAYLFYHPTASVNDNKWHTLTCARNGTDLTVTLDGVSFSPAGAENPGAIAVANEPLRFAQRLGGSTSDQFFGDIGFASFSE